MKCLCCPYRSQMQGKPCSGMVLGCRGVCKACYEYLKHRFRKGVLTEAQVIANGWMLPDTGEGARRQHLWSSGRAATVSQPLDNP